jgi:hypothetical protein
MKNTYKYWSNKHDWHDKLLFECIAESIIEADSKFKEQFDIDPRTSGWISCAISLTADKEK